MMEAQRPGPQPANQIQTMKNQFRRALTGRDGRERIRRLLVHVGFTDLQTEALVQAFLINERAVDLLGLKK